MFSFFKPKFVKEGEMLLKGVRKFLNYKEDIIAPERRADIDAAREAFAEALAARDRPKMEELAKGLHVVCEKAVPPQTNPGWRENVEVIFVAFVVAMGIRTYFLQPFKIPTGSMQPTLNGIIATPQFTPDESGELPEQPGMVRKVWDYLWFGRNYVEVVAPQDDRVVGAYEQTKFRFFTFTYIQLASGDTIKAYAPMAKLSSDLGLGNLGLVPDRDRDNNVSLVARDGGVPVERGQVLARGYVDTGDQVLVNRVSYHFRKPRRGEVFVFNTRGITGIERSQTFDRRFGSQHYIKRLAGLPGDVLEIREPELWINGERAREPGFVRVMEGAGDESSAYRGYMFQPRRLDPTGYGDHGVGEVGPHEYIALGDNSFASFDSKNWGAVPERNLVGPALMVYWPFGHHFGRIR